MSIDERKRHARYQRCEDVLGDEHADTLMELLPPVGWADVATKTDLSVLEAKLDRGFAELRAELHQALRQQLWAIPGVLAMAVVVSEIASRIS